MGFSDRAGLVPRKLVQHESMDEALRNSIWNAVSTHYWQHFRTRTNGSYWGDAVSGSNMDQLVAAIWADFYKSRLDSVPYTFNDTVAFVRTAFYAAQWNQVLDFVEFIAENGDEGTRNGFEDLCNYYFERENSAYRFVAGQVSEITSAEEIAEVEAAVESAGPFAGVRAHLAAALALMSDRENPDYRNSIKESISAVESVAKHLTKDPSATLGEVLSKMERDKVLHPALKKSFSALYGYTSNAAGIRHALMDEPNLTKADARFMLICCSAFINYSIELVA